jgi:vacuolar-type H+-ATPase subunit I/STV1
LKIDINLGKKEKKNNDQIQIEKNIMQFSFEINNKRYFSYDNIVSFLVALNIEGIYDLKMHFNHILTSTQKIYENYIKIINIYNDSIINKLSMDKTKIKDDVEKKYKNNYDKKIEKRDQKIKNLQKEIKQKDIELIKLREEITKLKINEYLDSDLENQADESEIDI